MTARAPGLEAAAGLRRARPGDRTEVAAFLARMDKAGLYQRHFAHGDAPNMDLLRRLDAADGPGRLVLLAIDAAGTVIGHAEYVADGMGAEFALMVLPGRRSQGLGHRLLLGLLAAAEMAGLGELHGLIQAGNDAAIRLVRMAGFHIRPGADRTTVVVSRRLYSAPEPAFTLLAAASDLPSPNLVRHDLDRVPLHRCAGP